MTTKGHWTKQTEISKLLCGHFNVPASQNWMLQRAGLFGDVNIIIGVKLILLLNKLCNAVVMIITFYYIVYGVRTHKNTVGGRGRNFNRTTQTSHHCLHCLWLWQRHALEKCNCMQSLSLLLGVYQWPVDWNVIVSGLSLCLCLSLSNLSGLLNC